MAKQRNNSNEEIRFQGIKGAVPAFAGGFVAGLATKAKMPGIDPKPIQPTKSPSKHQMTRFVSHPATKSPANAIGMPDLLLPNFST